MLDFYYNYDKINIKERGVKMEIFNLDKHSQSNGIYVIHIGSHKTTPSNCNDCYMAAYIAHGGGTLKIDRNSVLVSENDVFLIRPNIEYKFIPTQGLRRIDIYCCYFTFDIIENSYNNFKEQFEELKELLSENTAFIHAVDTDNKKIRDIFVRMIDESMSNLSCTYDMLTGYLIIMLTNILRNIKTRDFKRIYSQDRIVDEAMRYIIINLYSKVSLNEIAAHLHISPSFLCRRFKKITEMTTSEFINLLRVNKIKDILKNTDKPIKAIPEMFNCNIDYLKKVFKRETGMTMQEYKEKYNYKNGI